MISQAHLDSAGHYVVAINEQGRLMIYDIFELLKSHQMVSYITIVPSNHCTLVPSNHCTPVSSKHCTIIPQQLLYTICFVLQPSTPITDILEMDRSPSPHVSKLSTTLSSTKPVKKTSQTSRNSKTKETSTVGGVTLNLTRLKSILKGYGEYPAKYR